MENNQQRGGARITSNAEGTRTFDNEQPGQQLPVNIDKAGASEAAGNEEHSESSMPEKDNETLGTP